MARPSDKRAQPCEKMGYKACDGKERKGEIKHKHFIQSLIVK